MVFGVGPVVQTGRRRRRGFEEAKTIWAMTRIAVVVIDSGESGKNAGHQGC